MEIEFELENESFFWEETFLKHFLNFLKIKFVYFIAFKVGILYCFELFFKIILHKK